jgi:membrane protein implicated in regulation of membrane protease activity
MTMEHQQMHIIIIVMLHILNVLIPGLFHVMITNICEVTGMLLLSVLASSNKLTTTAALISLLPIMLIFIGFWKYQIADLIDLCCDFL